MAVRPVAGSTRRTPRFHPYGRFTPERPQSADLRRIGEDRLIDDLDHPDLFAAGYVEGKGPRRFQSTHRGLLDHANGTFIVVSPASVHLVPKGSQAITTHSGWRPGRILELGVIGEQGQPPISVTGVERRLIALDGGANEAVSG
jgi:hypothetical protein